MMIWQFGVAHALAQERSLMERVERVHGTSGGAIAAYLLLEQPERLTDCVAHYTNRDFFDGLKLRDVVSPHDALLRRTFARLDLLRPGAAARLGGRFVAHGTSFAGGRPANVAVDVAEDGDVLDAISASCCFDLSGVDVDGETLWDGGLSEPLSPDPTLPTLEVSIISGDAHVSPGAARPMAAGEAAKHPFLRYDWSPPNAAALAEAACLTPARAQYRFDQGRRDGEAFLELSR